MDATRFDGLARSFSSSLPRRRLSALLAVTSLGVLAGGPALEAKKKKKKKALKRNTFGCVNVGDACQGNSDNCCSGICEGSKPKKGKKDKSRCVAHGQSSCTAGQNETFCGAPSDIECTTSQGEDGFCVTTTGNAGYCNFQSDCFDCKKDRDCEAVFGAGAACAVCPDCALTGGTQCAQTLNL
jgi:hypothetical protein